VLATRNRRDFLLRHAAWLRWPAAWNVHPEHAGILAPRQDGNEHLTARAIDALLERALPFPNTRSRGDAASGERLPCERAAPGAPQVRR